MSELEIISYEPATGEEFWRSAASDVENAVRSARRAWPGWARQPLERRIECVERFADEVRNNAERFAELIARETGKPLWEAHTEVSAVVNKVAISIEAYAQRTGDKILSSGAQGTAAVRHKPHGVMLVLGPYNFPAHLPNGHMIPALIAGNVVLFKPSEKTPATGEFLVECYRRAGIPDDVVQLVIGGPDSGKALVAHPDIDGVLFTGSAPVGIAINTQLADNPGKIVALEMGGNNPIVVIDTPQVKDAATLIAQSAYTTSGQRCTAARRLIITESMYDAVLSELDALTGRLIVDGPFADPEPFMGPVIDNAAADQLIAGYDRLVENGGQVIRPMTRPQESLPFLTPGIIDTTSFEDRPDVELFGPLLQVIQVKDFESAIVEANRTRFGLSASLIGGEATDYERFWEHIRAGIINWNRPTSGASSHAPFGGLGLSGNHRPAAFYAADYCAYPVASTEFEQVQATISTGLAGS